MLPHYFVAQYALGNIHVHVQILPLSIQNTTHVQVCSKYILVCFNMKAISYRLFKAISSRASGSHSTGVCTYRYINL